MTNQYTNAKDVKNFIEKKIHEQYNKKEIENFSFDVIKAKDRINQNFLYISLTDNGNFVDNNFDNQLLEKLGSIIKDCIKKNCFNLMEIISVDEDSGRQLLWLPKDKDCFTIYERYEEIEQFSIKPVSKKHKIK